MGLLVLVLVLLVSQVTGRKRPRLVIIKDGNII